MEKNKAIISYEKFLEIFEFIKGEPEFEFYFADAKDTCYIVKYENTVEFECCDLTEKDIELFGFDKNDFSLKVLTFNSLEELYNVKLSNGFCFKEEWENITDIVVNGICLSVPDGVEEVFAVYKELNEKHEKWKLKKEIAKKKYGNKHI